MGTFPSQETSYYYKDIMFSEVKSLKINFQTNSFVPFTTLGREF